MGAIRSRRAAIGRPPRRPATQWPPSAHRRRPNLQTPSSVFDAVADSYDAQFTHTTIGALMREVVWRRLGARFAAGSRVLEMNCGTGEDALWMARRGVNVLAT